MANCLNILEQYHVTPESPAGGRDEMSLPLTYFDIQWIDSITIIDHLIFYEIPGVCHSQFVENYIPKLKNSLSSTLKDFLPLAGNLILPSDLGNPPPPQILYRNGDGVSIVFSESLKNNFEYLTAANYPRNSSEFYPLIPQLPIPKPMSDETDTKISPVLALQVTLFLGTGICLGIKYAHVVGDEMGYFAFFKTWALRSKLHGNGDEEEKELGLLFDRATVIKDAKGIASLFLNQLRTMNSAPSVNVSTTEITNKIRQKFVLSEKDIKMLKNIVLKKRPNVKHLSSFTITYAYAWLCLVKYNRVNYSNCLVFAVDCRGRVNPPIPLNFFGNCLTVFLVHPPNIDDHQELALNNGDGDGDDIFCTLVDKIGEEIHNKLLDKDRVLDDAETWITDRTKLDFNRTISVAGSPRYNYYHLDFGWGKPITSELISIDKTGAIHLSGCRDSEEGIEICVSTLKEKLETFSRAFNEGLSQLLI